MFEDQGAPKGYQPVYRAVKRIERHKCFDGKYRDFEPGEPIPGAETWSNPYLWCKRNFIERIDGKQATQNEPHGPYIPPHALTEEDVQHIAELKRKKLAGEDTGSPQWMKSTPQENEEYSRRPQAARDPSKAEMEAVPAVQNPASQKSLDELRALTRGELFRLVKEKGNIKVNGSESKDELAKALSAR